MNSHHYLRQRQRRRHDDAKFCRRDPVLSGINSIAARSIFLLFIASQFVEGFVVESQCAQRCSLHQRWNDQRLWRNNRVETANRDDNATLLRRAMTIQEGDMDEIFQQTNEMEKLTKQTIEELMLEFDPILLFASKLLPKDKADDASALYAWCRRLDEICDNEEDATSGNNLESVRQNLDVWQERFESLWTTADPYDDNPTNYPADEYLMDLALKRCIEKYQDSGGDPQKSLLTRVPFDDMIEGMKSDAVEGRRIQNMKELEIYAYRVAGTVGLMLLPLLLSESDEDKNDANRNEQTLLKIAEAREPAICLGKAIQLVNILRDATQDAKLGRIYLPQDMLSDEGVDDETILNLGLNPTLSQAPEGYTNVVKRVSNRALELLAIAETGKDTLPSPLGPLFVQIIVELYRDYLDELDRRGYDNLTSSSGEDRVKISTLRKAKASLRAIAKVCGELIMLS